MLTTYPWFVSFLLSLGAETPNLQKDTPTKHPRSLTNDFLP